MPTSSPTVQPANLHDHTHDHDHEHTHTDSDLDTHAHTHGVPIIDVQEGLGIQDVPEDEHDHDHDHDHEHRDVAQSTVSRKVDAGAAVYWVVAGVALLSVVFVRELKNKFF